MTTRNEGSLGRRIARLRLQHGMTQERLADIANVSAQAVSKWENDQSYPDILLLPILAKTFGVTIDELLGVESAAPEQPVIVEQPQPAVDAVDQTEPLPTPKQAPEVEATLETEAAPEPQEEPEVTSKSAIDEPATHIRLHVIQQGRDAINLAIPLAAARLVSNVASYIPDRITEGIDLLSFAKSAQSAGKGTLIDVNDGNDRVIITLE